LTIETTTLLHIFFGALAAWLILKSVPKLYQGRLEAIDTICSELYAGRIFRRFRSARNGCLKPPRT
jgi:hypothetical protein